MALTKEKQQKIKEVKKVITKKRIEIQEEKDTVDVMGEEIPAIHPEDIGVMYAGKLCQLLIKNNVASQNILSGFMRHYPSIDENMKAQLTQLQKDFSSEFETAKARTNKIASTHPLWLALQGIRGLTGYQVALIMSYMKDVERFDTPSKLMVYCGMGAIDGMPVTKANLNKIKEYYSAQGKEFKGFNTEFSGRILIVAECLIRGQGYFTNFYQKIRQRLETRAMNNNECFQATKEDVKASNNIMKLGKYYIHGHKNHSLMMWSDQNAKRRVARTFLHLLWAEWRKIMNLEVRHPYAIDYMGHKQYISLQEVLDYDRGVVVKRKKKGDAETLPPVAAE